MKAPRIIGLIFALTVSLAVGSSAMASALPAKKNCTVWKSGMAYKKVKHGSTYIFSDGNTEECNNGEWVIVAQGRSKSNSNSKPTKTVVRQWCETRTTGMTSSWWGESYSWTIWNEWSNGSRTVEKSGFGYSKNLPSGC